MSEEICCNGARRHSMEAGAPWDSPRTTWASSEQRPPSLNELPHDDLYHLSMGIISKENSFFPQMLPSKDSSLLLPPSSKAQASSEAPSRQILLNLHISIALKRNTSPQAANIGKESDGLRRKMALDSDNANQLSISSSIRVQGSGASLLDYGTSKGGKHWWQVLVSLLATWKHMGRNRSIFLFLYFFAASLIFPPLPPLVPACLPKTSPLPLEPFPITRELPEWSGNRKGVRYKRKISSWDVLGIWWSA